jgi:nitronate monooxygenase
MNWKNIFTQKLGIEYPFIQAPMLNVTTPAMVAAISNAVGLGSLPVGGLPPDKTLSLIQETKSLTNKPFAVNLFANRYSSSINEASWNNMQQLIEQFAGRYELPYQKISMQPLQFFSYEEQLEILLSQKIAVVSFTFGILEDDAINVLHKNGAQLIGTATSAEEAKVLSDNGIDMISAQGIEAGGHRGAFLHKDAPQVGLMALLPQAIDVTDKPVIAAGAIATGRSIRAAIMLGAKAVQAGSAFITCNESAANPTYKAALNQATGTSTVLTKSYTGRWMRCIKNAFTEMVDTSGLTVNEYPIQQLLTRFLRTLHEHKNAPAFLPMLVGQNPRKSESKGAAEIMMEMIQEAERVE